MFTVSWCDPEGNLHERPVRTMEDAILEAKDLKKKYDGVEILDPNGNPVQL